MSKTINLLDDQQWSSTGFDFKLPIERATAALGVIDVQHYSLDSEGHLAQSIEQHNAQLQQDFLQRADTMIANIQKLQGAFRKSGQPVLYTRHGAQTPGGADLVTRRRGREVFAKAATDQQSGHLATKGERAYEIDARVAPQPGEMVLDKNTSSAFHTTPIDLYLRNMGIDTLILTGCASDQCVLATAIDAADRGFHVILATDACANLDPGSAEATQILFGRVWGYVMTTEAILDWIRTGQSPDQTRLKA